MCSVYIQHSTTTDPRPETQMPVHDKHMQECDAEPAAKRQALAAVVTARNEPRSAYLEWRDRKLEESTNWLDYLQAVNEDAYHVLLRHFVNVQITDPPELRCTLEPDASSPVSFNWRFPHNLRYSLEYWTDSLRDPWSQFINLCGVKVYTLDPEYFSDNGGICLCCRPHDTGRNHLRAAAKANGIEVPTHGHYESQLYKALMSV